MFIALLGTPSSGKKTIEQWLIEKYQFKQVVLDLKPLTNGDTPSSSSTLTFNDPSELLSSITRTWQTNYVTTSLHTAEIIKPFMKRPFFLLIAVDGPMQTRFLREQRKATTLGQQLSLESFISHHDSLMSPPSTSTPSLKRSKANTLAPPPLAKADSSSSLNIKLSDLDINSSEKKINLREAMKLAQLNVMNNFEDKEGLFSYLEELDLLDGERLRPGWDAYFMTLASLASLRSNCMKRRVGALLVRQKRILSTGYNGTPRGLTNCNEGGCSRCNGEAKGGQSLAECLCLHAEENALLEAGRERVGADAVLYCNTCPCLTCSVKIVQCGVREVVYNLNYSMDEASARVLRNGGVILRQLVMPHTTT